ncbi:hypothetical protein BD626DRAFT_275626 [Schizophyllum amplum]|uniref:Uncharacterized protein n=1 Tax=Schizophyllum amplum TaxID=97359 RepID=A0A550CFX1_9AGAR|nr:hypothetical protein BD626DRAFT_275626 [Auriculariopsis ampla]
MRVFESTIKPPISRLLYDQANTNVGPCSILSILLHISALPVCITIWFTPDPPPPRSGFPTRSGYMSGRNISHFLFITPSRLSRRTLTIALASFLCFFSFRAVSTSIMFPIRIACPSAFTYASTFPILPLSMTNMNDLRRTASDSVFVNSYLKPSQDRKDVRTFECGPACALRGDVSPYRGHRRVLRPPVSSCGSRVDSTTGSTPADNAMILYCSSGILAKP